METPGSDLTVRTYGSRPPAVALVVPDDWLGDAIDPSDRDPDVGLRVIETGDGTDTDAVIEAVGSCQGIALSNDHDCAEPVALFDRSHPDAIEPTSALPIDHAVDTDGVAGTALTEAGLLEIELGPAAPEQFLRALLESDPAAERRTTFYSLSDAVPDGETVDLRVENFERVAPGTVFAEIDGNRLVANWPFYPVLFGECDTDGVLGYRGVLIGDSVAKVRAALREGT
jgi:hypothetical protein